MASTDPRDVLKQKANTANLQLDDAAFATIMDKEDTLASFRDKFHIPPVGDKQAVYLCGNSLGLQPKKTKEYILEELDAWQNQAVNGHFESKRSWLVADDFAVEYLAHIMGANKTEVVAMNSLTVNLHIMMVPFYNPTPERHKILMEYKPFPSDLYAMHSQAAIHGFDPKESVIHIAPREGEHTIRTEDILSVLEKEGQSIALVLLGAVQYYTGQYFEIQKITEAAHKQGCKVGLDLAHAAGNLPLELHDWDVDFACWCSYKYLNSGPGGIAGAFVHDKYANDKTLKRFAGWWGHELKTRFDMDQPFTPVPGAYGFRLSNPPIFQIAALLASLELFEEAGIQNLRKKSKLLTAYLELLLTKEFKPEEVAIITPLDPEHRGCQLSLLFKIDAVVLSKLLHNKGVVCDERKPNVIRVAPTPLYNTFEDVRTFVSVLRQCLQELKSNV